MPSAVLPGARGRTIQVPSKPHGRITVRDFKQTAAIKPNLQAVVPAPNSDGYTVLPDDAFMPEYDPAQFVIPNTGG